MKTLIAMVLVAIFCLAADEARAAKISLDMPPSVPDGLNAADVRELTARREGLLKQLSDANRKIDAQALECREVAEDSPKVSECKAKAEEVWAVVKSYRAALANFSSVRIIKSMNAFAKQLRWGAAEQARLATALDRLSFDGDPNATGGEIRRAWQAIQVRGADSSLAREASGGDGPAFPGAGTQSFQDCAVFALANAASQPYGVVAARATELIAKGPWRAADDRAHPQQTIEQEGLVGGEVIMLAEALGQAEVVPSSEFAATLKGGRPVMVNVVPQDGDFNGGHEVVLTKAFEHDGGTWYELIDSNQEPQRRLYLSSKELGTILKENGVAYRSDPGTVPKLPY